MKHKPLIINTDAAVKNIQPHEAMFIKDIESSISKNGSTVIASPIGEGQNDFVLTPVDSNIPIPGFLLPTVGFNRNSGNFESKQTNETYVFTYNSVGRHCIHVISGDDGSVKKIIEDPTLQFSDKQHTFKPEFRCALRVIRDADANIVEKILLITDFNTWQKWINVNASYKTNGFDHTQYPYWTVKQPHFDRRELVEWAPRPPMIMPEGEIIPATSGDGIINLVIDTSFQVCYNFSFTDGRETTVSPYSLPQTVKSFEYLSNPDLLPKRIKFIFYAGSPLVEKINIYVRQTRQNSSIMDRTYGDWYLYETIYKFPNSNNNMVIGTDYWLRINPWANRNYDPDKNTFEYVFDNSRVGMPVDQGMFRYQNDIPQISAAMTEAGDAVLLGNNRYGYDNVDLEPKMKFEVKYDDSTNQCRPKLRTVKLYCYVGRERMNQSDDKGLKLFDYWLSQVGYHVGVDKQERFGGIMFMTDRKTFGNNKEKDFVIDKDESKYFKLDFADRKGFRCYAKGTPFYADCEWHVCDRFRGLTPIGKLLDSEDAADKDFIQNILRDGKFFIGVFTFTGIPAGEYAFTLAGHNTPNGEDFRGKSTYVMGIADSNIIQEKNKSMDLHDPSDTVIEFPFTIRSMTPDSIVSRSKEIQVDCRNADVDMWNFVGNTFFIFCPFKGAGRDSELNWMFDGANPMDRWSLQEGYLLESTSNTGSRIPMELFNYEPTHIEHLSSGLYTDKNGFFFAYVWGDKSASTEADLKFPNKINCMVNTFTYSLGKDEHWKVATLSFAEKNSGQVVGYANRIKITGRMTTTTGIPLSRIAVTLEDGATDYTDDDGIFTIWAHSGWTNLYRYSRIYINSGGSFLISTANCGPIPYFVFDETSPDYPPCFIPGFEREYKQHIDLQLEVHGSELVSAKAGASYFGAAAFFDYAGRATWINRCNKMDVLDFVKRDNTNPAFFAWSLLQQLRLNTNPRTVDFKWIALYISKPINYRKYMQWVGDKIEFLDQYGAVTGDVQAADMVRINIQSLIETNFKHNFTLLSVYEFSKNDRVRIFDDGEGHFLATNTYRDCIDVEIQGTNYNQAAINAKLIPPGKNTVLNPEATTSAGPDPVTLYLKYDSRFDALKGKTGFWIELYTPDYDHQELNYGECEACFPIINGEIMKYTGGGINAPTYTPVTGGNIRYWDTYHLRRNIIGLGKYIGHPFESPNITDTWGANAYSTGRNSTNNPYARQMFYVDDVIKSDAFINNGIRNGLATFRGPAADTDNRKSFKRADFGGIVAMKNEGSIIFILCEKNWFIVDYNMIFLRASPDGGIIAANLTNNMSEPHQKVGSRSGCDHKDIASIIFGGGMVGWHDAENADYMLSDWKQSSGITDLQEQGRACGIEAYYGAKAEFVENHNNGIQEKDKFDIVAGYDRYREQLFVTFRPRRNNSSDPASFVNNRRDADLSHQETIVYSIEKKRWLRWSGFTPEAYSCLMGRIYAQEFLSFAAGKPYLHNNTGSVGWLNFYGVPVRPVLKIVVSDESDIVKVMKALKIDATPVKWVADLVHSDEKNSISYIPASMVSVRENIQYLPFMRDMGTYPPVEPDEQFRNMLLDGKPVRGTFIIIRLMPEPAGAGKYFELNVIDTDMFASVSNGQIKQQER